MKKIYPTVLGNVLILVLTGCIPFLTGTSTPTPTTIIVPSPTLAIASPTFTTAPLPVPTLTPTTGILVPTATATTSSGGGPVILPGAPSGPYAVILVAMSDVLNIRSAPGAGNPIVGSFSATATNVMRTGPSSTVDGDLWVEVQKPSGGNGWVNSHFLTEYVAPAAFCASASVNTLLASLDTALTTNNGVQLSGLVSPRHGMTVYLWRYGNPITFGQDDARWVF
ncbi:MAG: SH3 domain-containing protein, partial [Nitrospirota bacterium]